MEAADNPLKLSNGILLKTGLIAETHVWLNDKYTAIVLIVLVHVWRMMPLNTVIILAALQTIPNELYEAARVDGAGPFKMFRMITLPLISGAFFIALTQSKITAFQDLKFSYGMGMSITVMVVSIALSAVYVRRV